MHDKHQHHPHLDYENILIIKAREMHYFSNLFDKVLYLFRTGSLSIIRSISTLYTRNRYLPCQFCWHLPADAKRTSMYCCVYGVEILLMMDSEHVHNMQSTLSNKLEKQCISLAFIIRIYHDARSYECYILKLCMVMELKTDIQLSRGNGFVQCKMETWQQCLIILALGFIVLTVLPLVY